MVKDQKEYKKLKELSRSDIDRFDNRWHLIGWIALDKFYELWDDASDYRNINYDLLEHIYPGHRIAVDYSHMYCSHFISVNDNTKVLSRLLYIGLLSNDPRIRYQAYRDLVWDMAEMIGESLFKWKDNNPLPTGFCESEPRT